MAYYISLYDVNITLSLVNHSIIDDNTLIQRIIIMITQLYLLS